MEENKDELYEKAKKALLNAYPNFEDNIYFLETYDELKIFYNFMQKYSNDKNILLRTELLDLCEFKELISKLSSDENIDVSALFKQYNTEGRHSEYFSQIIMPIICIYHILGDKVRCFLGIQKVSGLFPQRKVAKTN